MTSVDDTLLVWEVLHVCFTLLPAGGATCRSHGLIVLLFEREYRMTTSIVFQSRLLSVKLVSNRIARHLHRAARSISV